jgi:hypothetical protein
MSFVGINELERFYLLSNPLQSFQIGEEKVGAFVGCGAEHVRCKRHSQSAVLFRKHDCELYHTTG